MTSALRVDLDDLHRIASALTGTASRVADEAGHPPPLDSTPRWSTSDTAQLAADSGRAQLRTISELLRTTADRLAATAEAYAEADARSATRLRAVGR